MNFLEVTGLLCIIYRLLIFLAWVVSKILYFLKPDVLKPQVGDYAIVTGATDGIGLEYAKQLAQKGYNLLLLSRNEDKLKRVAQEISLENPQCSSIETLQVDFAQVDVYESIREKVESLSGTLAILVNNVGIVFHIPEYFCNYPQGLNRDMINVNVLSVTLMSEIAIKEMLKHERGIVINVSSFAGITEFPLFSTYSATKAYMNTLGSALSSEYQENNIIIQTVVPNQVKTKASKDVHEELISVNSEDFVKYALRTVGKERLTSGHPKHKVINNLALFLNSFLGYNIFMKIKLLAGKDAHAKYRSAHQLEK